MEREGHSQTAPGEHPASSPLSRLCSAPLARLAPTAPAARLHLEIQMESALKRTAAASSPTISRAERAHFRLSWDERLARNARIDQAERMTLTLFGIPDRLATFLGLATV